MVSISKKKRQEVQEKVLHHYMENGRRLPWRETTNPYHILVSEIMLQQTQAERVIPYYLKFTRSYPTLGELAKAEKKDLLAHWSGLGYNSRVLRLQKLAQATNELPQNRDALLALPGIGPYTSAAILAFAWNVTAPVVDTNIRRIFIHELGLDEEISQQELEEVAMFMTPEGQARDWNNALMDYGALLKTARATKIASKGKQSKFEGSERQVRGNIVKDLLKDSPQQLDSLKEKFYHDNFDTIVEKMCKDGLVVRDGERLTFS